MEGKPRLLDLFCGAGGAGMGYHRAGFDVVGVDVKQQKRYPFEFHCADALEFAAAHGAEFDAIHASPPCQAYAITNNIWKKSETYPDLVAPTRKLLQALGLPYIIENVPGAPLQAGAAILCGEMFGLRVIRHRIFESNHLMMWPEHRAHTARASYGRRPKDGEHYTISGHFADIEGARIAMGVDWMTRDELAQAIPPAYTEYLGVQLLSAVQAERLRLAS